MNDELFTGGGISFAELRFGGQYVKLDAQTSLKIVGAGTGPAIEVSYGRLWFSSATGSPKIQITARAGAERVVQIRAEGTEYALEVRRSAGPEGVALVMIDGSARIQAGTDESIMSSMEEGRLVAGRWQQKPLASNDPRTGLVALNQKIQWALYYPAILDLSELPETLDGDAALADSVAAYVRGNLLEAARQYPRGATTDSQEPGSEPGETFRRPANASERLYIAALHLALGDVDGARSLLRRSDGSHGTGDVPDRETRLAHAFEIVIAAVTGESVGRSWEPSTSTEWIAESYYQQSRVHFPENPDPPSWEAKHYRRRDERLRRAWWAARQAVEVPRSVGMTPASYAEVRLAEMYFSLGDAFAATTTLGPALERAPENASAHVMHGFLLASRERIADAANAFQRAINLDPGLGSAWLGRGLCHFRRGEVGPGLADLEQAVAAEPNRSFYRSYLGKGYEEAADAVDRPWSRATREWLEGVRARSGPGLTTLLHRKATEQFETARRLDPEGPTSLLYSALLKRSQNRINEAVRDLEASIERNNNQALYRSDFLLDQDRAVRGVTLAQVYRDAGLDDVAVREASRAVTADYGNASAHLFLAGSYDSLRNVRQLNLRYDTPWQTELLLANLLKPVGAGSLSQTVSQQEYTRLFERERTGIFSATEYRSQGDWRQLGSVYGWQDNVAYAFDAAYETARGYGANQDVEALTLWAKVKLQASPSDSVYLEVRGFDFESGDRAQYYDPASASRTARYHERQEPILAAGYHHQWTPANHSLFLFSRLDHTLRASNPSVNRYLVIRQDSGLPDSFYTPGLIESDLEYEGDLEVYSFEFQQIWRLGEPRLGGVAGLRYQFGDFPTGERMMELRGVDYSVPGVVEPARPVSDQGVDPEFNRFTFYTYTTYEAIPARLWLTAGLTAESMTFPRNHRFSPVDGNSGRTEMIAPKAGIVIRLDERSALHAAYSRWLGGVSLEQSFSLEPSQIAGFTQNYRDVVPPSVTGALAGAENEMVGVLIDRRFPTDTYLAIQWQQLTAEEERIEGVFDSYLGIPIRPGGLSRALDYTEQALSVSLDQLLFNDWAVNLRYRLTDSELRSAYLPGELLSGLHNTQGAILHEVGIAGRWTHSSGLFAVVSGAWYHQDPDDSGANLAGEPDPFWQVNTEVGYRMLRRRLEFRTGVLNLFDEDYRLTPVTPYPELPRERTFFAALRLNF